MIYIDTPSKGYSHLIADNIDELHKFADNLEVKRCWFENKKNKNQPHYDIKESLFNKAIEFGAIKLTRKELFLKLKDISNDKRNFKTIS